ncbi:MAG: DUF2799 domain-containing protein [Bdellovibrionales bacterium]
MKKLILIGICFNLVSCASYFVKQDCNKTNWFEYGNKVALQGKRTDSDAYLKKCEKVGADINYADLDVGFKKGMAQYCTKQGAVDTGRKGDFLNLDFCETAKHSMLKSAHAEGVRDFCSSDNAYKVGVEGWEYNNICPKDQEANFLVHYKTGRKEFFKLEIERRQQRIAELNQNIRGYEREREQKYYQLRSLPKNRVIRRVKSPTSAGGSEIQVSESDEIAEQRNAIQSAIRRLDNQIQSAKSEQQQLSREIADSKRSLKAIR